MIIRELTAGVRILLEKGLSRHHISRDQQFQENTQKFLLCQKTKVARKRGQGEPPGAHTTPRRRPALATPPGGAATLAHLCQCPLMAYRLHPRWEPQEEGMMSTVASLPLVVKPRFIEPVGESQTSEGDVC
jgi:hypothetical protein